MSRIRGILKRYLWPFADDIDADIEEVEVEITKTLAELNALYKRYGVRRRVEARYIKLARTQEEIIVDH